MPYPVPAYKPLPPALTQPLPLPPRPPAHCVFQGAPAVCVLDALMWAGQLRDVLTTANADRAKAAHLTQPQGDTP